MAQSKFWENLNKLDGIAGETGRKAQVKTTAEYVSEISSGIGLSPDQEAALQLGIAKENNRLGLDNARIAGNSDIADRVTTDIASAALSDMGEYGKAAMALWNEVPEYEQEFMAFFGENPEMKQLIFNKIGEYGAHGKNTNNNNVDFYDVAEAANAILNPRKGWFGSQSKEQKEILALKNAYQNGDASSLEAILDKVLTRVLGKIVVQIQ